MVKISFSFDRPNYQYNPGDTINLEVCVQVDSNTKFRSIYARIQGYAHVQWSEREHHRRYRRHGRSHESYTEYVTYCSHQTFFKNYLTLAGAPAGPAIRLAAGSHVYHASFVLPRNLPENHEHKYGHIRYEAKVHMDIPWAFAKKERANFYVNPRIDLNEYPHLRGPVRAAAGKTFGFCCWGSKPLHIYNVLPRGGYVPGDRIQYSLELNNDSNISINGATVILVEKTEYHAFRGTTLRSLHSRHYDDYEDYEYCQRSKTRENCRTLWRHEFSGNRHQLVAAMQKKVLTTDLHFAPFWNFRFFGGCNIITVRYYLISEARTSGFHTNLTNCTYIYMGTIPFQR